MSKYYPDISHFESVKDWDAVKANVPFLITKATQRTNHIDSNLKSVITNCEYKQIPYWVFAYLEKGNELAQTKYLVKTCRDLVGDYFVGYCLDAEENNNPNDILDSIAYLRKVSRKIMLYTQYSQYGVLKKAIKERGDDVAWWESRYGFDDGKYYPVFPPHSGVDLHQYTQHGKCPGIYGESGIDVNRLTGGLPESWFATPTRDILQKDSLLDPKFPKRGYFKYKDGMKTLLEYRPEIKKAQIITNKCLRDGEDLIVDGEYGKKTKEKVLKMQKSLGVVPDGKFGPKTLTASHDFMIFS